MSAASDFARLQSLPPAEAVAYMAGRELVGETNSWADLWQGEHARAFTVSRLARADLLEALQQSLAKSVAGDLTRRDWLKDTQKLLENSGWWGTKTVVDPRTGEELTTHFTPARLQLIYDTNARQAAAAGQWQRMVRHQRTHPYARYISRDDGRVRPLHRAWHGVTLALDDPWWNEHRPPNGWRCRCRVVGVTQADYERGSYPERPGAEGEDGASAPLVQQPMNKGRPAGEGHTTAWQHPQTGEELQTPAGVDPGFAYNAGTPEARSKAFEEVVARKLAGMEPRWREAVQAQRLTVGLENPDFTGQRPGLANVPPLPVVELTGEEFGAGLTHAQLMAQATKLLKKIQATDGLVNDDTGWLLTVNRKGVKKMGDNQEQGRPSLQAVAALEALVRGAVVVERHRDSAHENEFVASISRLFSPVQIAGQFYRVKLTVKDFRQGSDARKLLHALDVVEIESALPLGTLPNSPGLGVGTTQPTTAGRFISIEALLKTAKKEDGRRDDAAGSCPQGRVTPHCAASEGQPGA